MFAGGEEMPDAAGVDGRVGRGRRMGVGHCTDRRMGLEWGLNCRRRAGGCVGWNGCLAVGSKAGRTASWVLAVERWLSLIGIWVWTELLECQAVQLGWVLQSEVAVVRDGWWLRAQVGDGQLEAVEVDEGQGPSDAGSNGKIFCSFLLSFYPPDWTGHADRRRQSGVAETHLWARKLR
ncbi:hypothetical protein ACLOJK_041863 [Asimina triloba]